MTLVSGKEIKYLSIPFREEINKFSPVINVYFYFYIFSGHNLTSDGVV